MAGYSGTPLAAKLGLKTDSKIAVVGAPIDYLQIVSPLPEGVKVSRRTSRNVDLVHVFSTRRVELAERLKSYRTALKPTVAVWVSWPKKASRVPTDITEDTIREVALPLGFVDVKVCAVSEVWSGLKLVVRNNLR